MTETENLKIRQLYIGSNFLYITLLISDWIYFFDTCFFTGFRKNSFPNMFVT